MCSIEYTPSEVQNGMEAFDLGAVAAATAANAATAQVFTFKQVYEYSIVLSNPLKEKKLNSIKPSPLIILVYFQQILLFLKKS